MMSKIQRERRRREKRRYRWSHGDTALWTSMENFLARFEHEDESKELNRLVAELRMGGRLNGVIYLI